MLITLLFLMSPASRALISPAKVFVVSATPSRSLQRVEPGTETYEFRLCRGDTCEVLGRGHYSAIDLREVAHMDEERASRVHRLFLNPIKSKSLALLIATATALSAVGVEQVSSHHFLNPGVIILSGVSGFMFGPAWAPLLRAYRARRATLDKQTMRAALSKPVQMSDKEFVHFVARLKNVLRRIDKGVYCTLELTDSDFS